MASTYLSFGKVILLPSLAFLVFIGITTDARRIKGSFECTRPPTPVTCDRNDLPKVLDGSFDCPGSTDVATGNACNLNCYFGFYPASTNQIVCQEVTGDRKGKWSEGNYLCQNCSNIWDGRTYRFFLLEMTFEYATENCQSVDSNLVVIESQQENNFVHQLLLTCAPDKGQWKGWTWINSTEYTNWDKGEPAHGKRAPCQKEECVSMKYDSGKWHDQCCNRAFYSVCEKLHGS